MKIAASLLIAVLAFAGRAGSSPLSPLGDRIEAIMARPALKHVLFGLLVYDLDKHRAVYAFNADKSFRAASTTKLLTEGTSLRLLGSGYRFVTALYRTGPLAADGTVDGNLVLLASGDPNLSGRLESGDRLAFENTDHSPGGTPRARSVPGDPLLVIRNIAKEAASAGVRRVRGRVLVYSTLFSERLLMAGYGPTISPISVNDNVVDITLVPGRAQGAPVSMTVSPQTAYVHVVNKVQTGGAASVRAVDLADDADADGNRVVTVTGTMPARSPSILYNYNVPSPKRFAEIALAQALREQGVTVDDPTTDALVHGQYAVYYTGANRVASHRSAPLREDVKVTLKVSDNLHASMMPFLWGTLAGHAQSNQLAAGFDLENKFLRAAGLDAGAAVQSDGFGAEGYFTPHFMVSYLAFMRRQPEFNDFYAGLPVLGKDGTLSTTQVNSPAAGKVHAKTGSWWASDLLNYRTNVTAKGLAGYMTTKDGRHLAFCFYLNNMPGAPGLDAVHAAGEVLGEMATAAYLLRP